MPRDRDVWTMEDLVDALAGAIARQEGFYVAGSKAQRNHNPGNLRPWPGCRLAVADGMIRFASDADGWRQLRAQVRKNIGRDLTLAEFFGGQRDESGAVIPGGYYGYAPAADKNDPSGYARTVGRAVGLATDVPLMEVLGDRRR